MTTAERRTSPRFPARAGHYASFPGGSGPIQDISLAGMFIKDREPVPEGTSLTFTLHLDEETLVVPGIVRRSLPNEGMAIQFQEMSPEAREGLHKYLQAAGI